MANQQQELFRQGRAAGTEARDDALQRVEEHAPPTWNDLAYQTLLDYARSHAEFTAPEFVIATGLPKAPEQRALGAVIRHAASDGMIENTYRTRKSPDPGQHVRPCTIWRSAVLGDH